MKEYLEAGRIINKRGLNGELKVESYCDSPDVFCSLDRVYLDSDGKIEKRLLSAKLYKNWVYIKLEGVNTSDDADRLKNCILYLHRDDIDIDDDSIFIDDILGLNVIDIDNGTVYGVLDEVFNRGASDIYRVVNKNKEYLIPAVDEIVIEIDVEKGIFIRPIPGLIDDAEEIR